MGVWGTGLYSGDFAKDLSSATRAVAQLPFAGERLADLLCSVEPGAANNASDEDHTTFWLVVADQFAKRGIVCERVRQRALEIIDGGEDVGMLSRLGLDAAGLKKRGKILAELREKIGSIAVDSEKMKRCFPKEPTGRSAAVNDISIANRLSVGPALRREQIHVAGEPQNNKWGRQHEGIQRLAEILC